MEVKTMDSPKYVFDKKTGTYQQNKPASQSKPLPIHDSQSQVRSEAEKSEDVGELVYKFRASSDLTSFQVIDEQTRKPMMIISGYALSMKFNMAELRSSTKVEQLLSGLTEMFRKMIIEQSLSGNKE